MKNLIKVMLLPVFLLASLSVFAKAPDIEGTWQITKVTSPADPIIALTQYKGTYVFDDLMVSPNGMQLTAIDNIPGGGAVKLAVGTWMIEKITSTSTKVKGVYSREVKQGDKVVATYISVLTVKANAMNQATGTIVVTKKTAGGFSSSVTFNLELKKVFALQ